MAEPDSTHPYTTPAADISTQAQDAEYTPRVFSVSGRIGRLRFFAYGMLYYLLFAIVVGILAATLGAALLDPNTLATNFTVLIPVYLAVFAISFMVTRRRLHDIDLSAVWFLAYLVPFVNILFSLFLSVKSGSPGTNRFGPKPIKNSTALLAFAGVGLLLGVAFIVFAIFNIEAIIQAQAEATNS